MEETGETGSGFARHFASLRNVGCLKVWQLLLPAVSQVLGCPQIASVTFSSFSNCRNVLKVQTIRYF